MTFYLLAFGVLAALFFLLALKFHKLGQETTKLRYQRSVLRKNFCKFGPFAVLPNVVVEVLDEIEDE